MKKKFLQIMKFLLACYGKGNQGMQILYLGKFPFGFWVINFQTLVNKGY